MGVEQSTPILGSSIDLLQYKDRSDLRLPRAFRALAGFKANHPLEIVDIGTLSPERIVTLADELSNLISKVINIDVERNSINYVEIEKLVQLRDIILGEGNRIIFMRHGEQSPPEWIASIPDPAIRKIRMMQNPANREDALTNRGFVDAFITAFGLLYLRQSTGRTLHILSSENKRAEEMAKIVSVIIPGTTFATEEGLNCISYRDEFDDPPVSLEQLLQQLSSGNMSWIPSLVDRLCKRTRSERSPSEVIINTVTDLLNKRTGGEANDLVIVFTHTQHLAEVLRSTGNLPDLSIRFPELTMIVVGEDQSCRVLPGGILTNQRISQQYQPSLFNFYKLDSLYTLGVLSNE